MDADVVILGAGIAGMALAAQLAPHRRVIIVEREAAVGAGTTARSAAMFMPSYGGPAITPLARASLPFLRAASGVGGRVFTPRPALHIGRQADLSRFGVAQAGDIALQPLSSRAAVELVPILRGGAIDGAWLEAEAGDLDVAVLLDIFTRTAREAGARFMLGAGESRIDQHRGRWRLKGAWGQIHADILVNATGPWADGVAREAGLSPIGLSPLRRTVILAPALKHSGFGDWPVVKDARERFYFRPYHGSLLITPADAHPAPPGEPAPEAEDIARAVLRFETACDQKVSRIEHAWAGLRTFAPDRAPVIGWSGQAPAFFWLAALGGFGIQTSPAVGRLAASQILGQETPDDLARQGIDPRLFAPARLDQARPGD